MDLDRAQIIGFPPLTQRRTELNGTSRARERETAAPRHTVQYDGVWQGKRQIAAQTRPPESLRHTTRTHVLIDANYFGGGQGWKDIGVVHVVYSRSGLTDGGCRNSFVRVCVVICERFRADFKACTIMHVKCVREHISMQKRLRTLLLPFFCVVNTPLIIIRSHRPAHVKCAAYNISIIIDFNTK